MNTPPVVIVTDADTLAALVEAAVTRAIAAAFAEGQRSTLPPVMTVAEAARRFGVSRGRLDGAIAAGDLPCKRVGSRVLVTAADVTALMTAPPKARRRGYGSEHEHRPFRAGGPNGGTTAHVDREDAGQEREAVAQEEGENVSFQIETRPVQIGRASEPGSEEHRAQSLRTDDVGRFTRNLCG